MIHQMSRIIEAFYTRVEDRSTLDELHQMIADESSWPQAHALFDRIRVKTLAADRSNDRASAQYCFEELCAQTLYNLTDTDAPFDPDAPYWVVPAALCLARGLGMDETQITNIVAV